MTVSKLDIADYRALAQFRRSLREFLAFSEKAANGAGLTSAQHQALLAIMGLSGGEPVTVGALARHLGIKPHSAVGLADRLAALKLLRRAADPKDRRRVTLTLTAKARAKLAVLSAVHRRELKRLAPLLGPFLKSLD